MKRYRRILALLLCLLVLLAAAGCGSQEETSEPEEPAETKEETPEEILKRAPEEYDFAVTVSINPSFVIYVNDRECVGYEALNEEASSIEERCAIIGRGLEGAVNDIVRFAYDEGFLTDGGEVTISIIAASATKTEADELLAEAEKAALSAAKNCRITVTPVITVLQTVSFQPEPAESEADETDPPQDAQPSEQTGPAQETQPPEQTYPPTEDRESGEGNNNETYPGPAPQPDEDEPEEHAARDPDEGCPVCQGTGNCDRCYGTGTVICDECKGTGFDTCSKCWGSGYAGSVVCDQCGGTGDVIHGICSGSGYKICPACLGTGLCHECAGTGKNIYN